jgi:hypothetical protein
MSCAGTQRSIVTEPTSRPLTEEERKKAAILGHVAQIANACSYIALNPHDRSNVGVQVGNLFGNILGIALQAGKKNGILDLRATEQFINSLDEKTKMQLAGVIAQEMKRCIRI